jgi:DNA-binding MurR/RpiR family transcriptional regulator
VFENVRVLTESSTSEIFEQILRIRTEDVLIGISFLQILKANGEHVRYAKDWGATDIAITDSDSSPIAKIADTA